MNFKEMCRTCLRSGEVMSSIFDEEIETAKHTAADLLTMFTSVQVDKDDDFPHNICNDCLKEIQQAYLFDLKCKKSEIILHQLREIRVNLNNVKAIPKQNDIVSEVAGELESILKEDFKLEDVMNLCDRNMSVSESSAIGRIRSVEEDNPNASDKLNFEIVEEECTRDLQVAFKRESDHSNYFMTNDTDEKMVERIQIVSNCQTVEEDCDPQITLKQEPDHNSLIIRNNAAQNELELNQNSSNYKILDKCSPEYQVIFNTERDQNNHLINDNENEEELEFNVTDFPVTFKSEPELDIDIDCNDERLQCSVCLKQFQSLDMFRGHIVSDHLEENICKLCNEEFECSKFEHSAKHLPFSYLDATESENLSGSSEESIRQIEKAHMLALHKGEYNLANRTGEKSFGCELCPEKFGNISALLCHRRTKHTDELISDNKLQCSVCSKIFGYKCLLRDHMRVHTGEKPFQCKLCPAKFGHNNSLLYHRRTKHTDKLVSDIPDFQCSVCYKIFGQKYLLKNHMPVHIGEKPFQCNLCPERFRISSELLCHRQSKHTDKVISDIPDSQCSVCYKIFGQKWLLRRHMHVHTGEKPYQCKLCPQKFQRSDSLRIHVQRKH